MTVRNLDALFKPKAIALIGASRHERSVGAVLARNLFRAGFQGPILPVHPRNLSVEGVLAYADIDALPIVPDLAIIATPPATVPDLIRRLGERGCRGAVVITAGFGEGADDAGMALRQAMLKAARPHLLRIIGPNCLGILVPGSGVNASFSHVAALPGDIACVTQSGAVATALLDWATARGIGFSHVVSLGDSSDVDFGDMLDYLALDPGTKSVLLYIEGVTHARKFMSAARALSRLKPVVVIKAGRHQAAAAAASSHTGAMAGSDAVYDAAFRRAGMLRVTDLGDLFAAVETLARLPVLRGERVAIITNGGGMGVLATDALLDEGGVLATLAPETLTQLDAALPHTWSRANPVDIIGDAPGARYCAALDGVLADPGVDAVLLLNAPTAVASSVEAAEAVIGHLKPGDKPVLTSWMGELDARDARNRFRTADLPSFSTPTDAVKGLMHLVRYRRNQAQLQQLPPVMPDAGPDSGTPDRAAVSAILATVRAEGREWLDEAETKRVLAAYGVPVVRTVAVETPEEILAAAADLSLPLAVKIRSPDITHKSDIGGVALDLPSVESAKEAAVAMLRRVQAVKPEAVIAGFTVQEMIRRPGAFELIVGIASDPTFGPVVLFGHGGVAVEVRNDKALALPPLNLPLAYELIQRTRIARQLAGFRARPPANLEAIASALIQVAQLAIDHPSLRELDINPLLADETGVVALDARIRVQDPANAAPVAVPPYPNQLETEAVIRDGTRISLRPIRPEDAPDIISMIEQVAPEDVRLRFFSSLKSIPRPLLARLTQIDYDREMAFVARPIDADGALGPIWGTVRLTCDADLTLGEYAILIRSDIKGRGLGYTLMRQIIGYGQDRKVGKIVGTILRENEPMLTMARELGFRLAASAEDTGVMEAVMDVVSN